MIKKNYKMYRKNYLIKSSIAQQGITNGKNTLK